MIIWMDEFIYRWIDKFYMDGWMDGWMSRVILSIPCHR